MLRGLDGNAARDALEVVEDAARAAAARFEARALWPRILARLLAAKAVAAPESDPAAPPAVQLVEGDDAEASALALSEWRAAADCLRFMLGEHGAWAPR